MRGTHRLPARVIRYGVDEPLPERRLVRAGPLGGVLEKGDLRYISVGGEEVVRRIYVAVRDRNWGTIPARFTSYVVTQDDDGFSVKFMAEHVNDEVDFVWTGSLSGTADGVITCLLAGEARRTFLKNRIGFCVLHPMSLAGREARVVTPNGSVEGRFPRLISPHQPFVDMTAIEYEGGDGHLTVSFEGDIFEMEDQRNWTDASYKSYSTPLRCPFPAVIEQGERVEQKITVRWEGCQPAATPQAAYAAPEFDIEIGSKRQGSLPAVGLAIAGHGVLPESLQLGWLRALNLAHLRLALDLTKSEWRHRLDYGARVAQDIGVPLELELIATDGGGGIAELAAAMRHVRPSLARVLVFPRTGMVTTKPVIERARAELPGVVGDAPIGGGSRAHFTELNRATLPLESMDVVGYGFNPQVHAFDNASLVETLAAQPLTVQSAQAIADGRPLAVGPITLRPPFNPNATGPEPRNPNPLPPSVDRRQVSLLAGGWLIGSLRRLAEAAPESLTYFETTGWRGVIERTDGQHRDDLFPWMPGAHFPIFHVFADVGQVSNPSLLPVTVREPLKFDVLALKYRAGGTATARVLVASFRDESQVVRLAMPAFRSGTIRLLDETTAEQAMFDPSRFRDRVDHHLDDPTTELTVSLRPFGLATIEVVLIDLPD